jgi:Icc-related predicted phosphoesterase
MIIDCISDLHGYSPELEGGDLLIVAGDLSDADGLNEHYDIASWISEQKYTRKIVVAGNHDNLLQNNVNFYSKLKDISYLCDSGVEFEGLKIWGSPWTKTFQGMNPKCKAFTVDSEEEIAKKWALIPDDIDILITHCPPNGILDGLQSGHSSGSISLRNRSTAIAPKLHVFGHIHEWGGHQIDMTPTLYVNASHVDECYDPINKAVRVIL